MSSTRTNRLDDSVVPWLSFSEFVKCRIPAVCVVCVCARAYTSYTEVQCSC